VFFLAEAQRELQMFVGDADMQESSAFFLAKAQRRKERKVIYVFLLT
jgi:hypothetical protein